MSQQIAEKHKAPGTIDPFVDIRKVAEELGISVRVAKRLASQGELEILRISERRCACRRSNIDHFKATRQSAVVVTGKNRAPRRLGVMAKLKPEIADGAR
jgi:hypothetical protein